VSLEQLWAGWRHDYVVSAGEAERASGVEGSRGGEEGCVFCRIAASGDPSADNGIVWRGNDVFAVLNAYPYASGHLLVCPVRHVERLDELEPAESADFWAATIDATRAIEASYHPDGLNLGANLGRAAGAGIPRHLHVHVVPRWSGDTNFMTTVGGTRVIPEAISTAWAKLSAAWSSQ
jgi:diadenosine tetraphosphate (Ap4A) HIT family hydrolase